MATPQPNSPEPTRAPASLPGGEPRLRDLKAAAQRLRPLLWIGKSGVTPEFLAALDEALQAHELVKVKFESFKEEKKRLAPELAEKTGSRLVLRVGNVGVYYRSRQGAAVGPVPSPGDPGSRQGRAAPSAPERRAAECPPYQA